MEATQSLAVLRPLLRSDEAALEQVFSSPCFDVDRFYSFLVWNHLAGTFYWISQATCIGRASPRELVERCKLAYFQQWGKNQMQLRSASHLRRAFAEQSVAILFLKGIFLAQRFYGSIDARASSDLDLLVRKSDVGRAEDILRTAGFTRRSRILWSRNTTIRFTHHFEYFRDSIDLELHWSVAQHPAFHLNYTDLWSGGQELALGAERFKVLSDEYAIVTHALGTFKDIELGTCTLKPFVDLFRMLQKADSDLDWEEFFERRKREGIFRIMASILAMTLVLFECDSAFPNLSECLRRRGEHRRIQSARHVLALVSGKRKYAVENRRWAWNLYELNPLRSVAWWLISLPFRIAVTPRA